MIITSDKQIVYVNSRNRESGTDNDFIYTIDLRPNNDFTHVVILQASISKSFYTIQTGYNTFTLVENGQQASVVLPASNYTSQCHSRLPAH